MYTLCFLSDLTSAEWAAWVQAGGSIVAIFAAAGVAILQAHLHHRNAIRLHKREHLAAKLDLGRALTVISRNSSIAIDHISAQLSSASAVFDVARGITYCDIGEVKRTNRYLEAIPLHSMPPTLVTHTMILGSIVRQFAERVELVLRVHHQMDSSMFLDFFKTLGEMKEAAASTTSTIAAKVRELELDGERDEGAAMTVARPARDNQSGA